MKKFDFVIQSIVFITAISITAYSIFHNDMLSILALVQLFLGGWQLLSWFISIIGIGKAKTSIRTGYTSYTLSVVVYFIICFAGSQMDVDGQIVMIYLFGPPWIIGTYYYYLTYQMIQTKRNEQHSFLDIY